MVTTTARRTFVFPIANVAVDIVMPIVTVSSLGASSIMSLSKLLSLSLAALRKP